MLKYYVKYLPSLVIDSTIFYYVMQHIPNLFKCIDVNCGTSYLYLFAIDSNCMWRNVRQDMNVVLKQEKPVFIL